MFFGLLILCFGMLGLVSAQENNGLGVNIGDLSCNQIAFLVSHLNATIPSFVPYTNEVFNFYIGEEFFAEIVLEEKQVKEAFCEVNEERTYDVYIKDIQTIKDISDSENPLDEYHSKKSAGEIQIKGATFGKSVKQFFVNIGLKIVGWFN